MTKNEYSSILKEYPALTNIPDFAIHRSMFIGCGGLGFESINLLKKRVQHYFGENLNSLMPLKFLSVDSADAQLQESKSVLDVQNEMLRLNLGGWRNISEQYPGVRDDWFPNMNAMPNNIREKILREFPAGAQGCGTTRIFGRLGIFCDNFDQDLAEHIKEFAMRTVENKYNVKQLSKHLSEDADVTDKKDIYFYIITSIGGGTGTGVFMDTAAIIRSVQQELSLDQTWHIYGVFVLPTLLTRADPSGGIEKLNANSYAALKELMHFLDGKPFTARYGISGNRKVSIDGKRSETTLFNVAFLLDGETQEGFALKSRLEVADFISGLLFQLSMTKAGDQHFQRHIDQAMKGIFNNRIPESGDSRVVAPQRPSFASFGWATAHIPLEEMIEYAQIDAAVKILMDMGQDSEEPDDDEVSEYFFKPQSGTEDERFIDKTGLAKIIDISYWNTQARQEHDEKIDKNTGKTEIFSPEYFKKAGFNVQDTDARLEESMGKSLDEIMSTLSKAMSKDIDLEKLREIANDFLEKYLAETLSVEKSFDPLESGKLGEAILNAQSKGQRFVLAGLGDLDEDLEELKQRADHKIDKLDKNLKKEVNDRRECFNQIQEQHCELWTNMLWSFRIRKDVKDVLEEFFDNDKKCKELLFKKEVLKILSKTIIPKYEKQVENWYKHILDVNKSLGKSLVECIASLKRMKKKVLSDIDTNTGSDFNIRFSDKIRNKFKKLFFKEIHFTTIKKDIITNGIIIGAPPEAMPFLTFLNKFTTQEITEKIINIIKKATDSAINASKGNRQSIFRLNFDDFTSEEKDGIFWNSDHGGDIQAIHSKLIRHGERMVKLEGFGGAEEKHHIFNSSIWGARIQNNPLHGLYAHKVTHMELALGFAPYQLFYIHKWHRAYKKLLKKGEPLHIFKDAETWDEPYTVYFYNIDAENIFELACKKEFGSFIKKDEDDQYRINKIIVDRFIGSHCYFTIQENRPDIIRELNSNSDIYGQLLKEMIKAVTDHDDYDNSKLAKEGWLPADLQNKLQPAAAPITDRNKMGIKNPVRLFELALEFGLIKDINIDDEEPYMLKVYFLPKTRECNWFIKEERTTIIQELRLNEPLFELFCKRMIEYVEFVANDRNTKVNLFKELMPYLPPHFRGPLEAEYQTSNVR